MRKRTPTTKSLIPGTLACMAVMFHSALIHGDPPTKPAPRLPAMEIANRHYRIVLDTAHPGLLALESRGAGIHGKMLSARVAQPLFALALQENEAPPGAKPQSWNLTSLDFSTVSLGRTVVGNQTTTVWSLLWRSGTLQLRVRLTVESDDSLESILTAAITANREVDARFAFPILDGLRIGPRPEEAWYFHPRWCGLLNDAPAELVSTYGQYVRMQVMAAYHPSASVRGEPAGIYLVTRDTTMRRKTYELVKRVRGVVPIKLRDEYGFPSWFGFRTQDGIGMSVNWLRLSLRTNQALRVPPVVLGLGACDWRDALASYGRWARTWCPLHDRVARDCFQHASFDLFSQPNCETALTELDQHPCPDYMQFMVQKTHVNGEYGYREDWGLPELQRFVQECQRRGIATNHYVEGYVASAGSRVWKERGAEWGQMSGKEFQRAFANQCLWLAWPDWHRWLTGETSRLARDLGLDTLYLDEIGFGTGDKCFSDNPLHKPGRLQIDAAMTGVRDLLRTVRDGLDKVNPRIALYTEGPAVDCLFPYLDGVEDYSCRQWNSLPGPYRIPVHFLRFVFPDFKFADIPEGTGEEVDRQIRLCLFNGIGTFTGLASGDPAEWLERIHVVERESRDAFNDLHPEPLVPTLHEGVFCNRFKAAGKTIYTLYNTNDYAVSGHVLHLPAAREPGHYVDLLRCADLRVDRGRWGARAVLALGSSDVAAIAALPSHLRRRREGEHFWLTGPRLGEEEKIVLTSLDHDDITREHRPFSQGSGGFSLAEATGNGRDRVALKLLRTGILQDLLPLPDLPTLDLAEDSVASGSVQAGGRDPQTVTGAKPGIYAFNWDDKERWVQLQWTTPQTFNTSEVRCTDSVYSPQRYAYLTSQEGQEWTALAEVNREGKPTFDGHDSLSLVTTRYLRLRIDRGGPWGDHVEIVRWRLRCRPTEGPEVR